MERLLAQKGKGYATEHLKEAIPGDRHAMEKAWEQVITWEAMHGGGMKCGGIKLISYAKFKKNRSPSAMWAVFWGHKPPYERQDWIIDRCGHINRYIIDFYKRPRDPRDPTSPEDALVIYSRPSIRNWDGAKLRMKRGWRRLVAKVTFGRYGFTE
ncbi:hypothetical protein M408DRAFT_14793 [Serendipita vermifera MAFF 305830]|uniref:Holocytochrome c-type synthase n=1 Tax=Serendipita vermifera MAFF 305830 TaxID=933852 RepID=A0A0C2XUF8_SERVB|nr:hypothetical protein M408DRAFT_14793 [Serendipita vermifera MAFF 305830]